MNNNSEIKEYLEYYCQLNTAPNYAVMLKGKWGTGKTWFIRTVIKAALADGNKILYVSLYGLTNVQQIDDELFRQLHPVLGSNGAAFAGRLAKGIIKGTLKFDWDGDGRSDGNAAVSIPDLNWPEFLKKTHGVLLVFDDLERCSLPIAETLGYINYFVEHDGRKVVLIGNEEEIINRESVAGIKAIEVYTRIKEKLIGQIFEIVPDIIAATDHFISEVGLESTRILLAKHVQVLHRIYADAAYKNLRHLRQAIFDFARLMQSLDSAVHKKEALVSHLLSLFLILSLEIKSGFIKPRDISNIKSGVYVHISSSGESKNETLYSILRKKYKGVDIYEMLLPEAVWEDFFETGIYDAVKINESLRNGKYFVSPSQPDWVRLWNGLSLSDEDMERALLSVDAQFRAFEFREIGVLKHVVSTLMSFIELGLYSTTKEEVYEVGINTLLDMSRHGDLARATIAENESRGGTGYAGLGFHLVSSDHFQNFCEELKNMGQEALEKSYPAEALALLEVMRQDTDEFVASLVHHNHMSSRFVGVPILAYIDINQFVDIVRTLQNDKLATVSNLFIDRYASGHYRSMLKPERAWLVALMGKLTVISETKRNKVSGIRIKWVVEAIRGAIVNFDSVA